LQKKGRGDTHILAKEKGGECSLFLEKPYTWGRKKTRKGVIKKKRKGGCSPKNISGKKKKKKQPRKKKGEKEKIRLVWARKSGRPNTGWTWNIKFS